MARILPWVVENRSNRRIRSPRDIERRKFRHNRRRQSTEVWRSYHLISPRTVPGRMMPIVSCRSRVKSHLRTPVRSSVEITHQSPIILSVSLAMPVLEDGLSDSECISGDEQSSPMKVKSNGRHQSTQSDFLFDSNHSSLINASHKRQFAKSTATNGQESQPKSFYIRPPPPSSIVRPVQSPRPTPPPASTTESPTNVPKPATEEVPPAPTPAGKRCGSSAVG
jgi:hypothetical protein